MNFHLSALLSLTLTTSILLSAVHASTLPTLRAKGRQQAEAGIRKVIKDEPGSSSLIKISSEAHPHVEKQTLKNAMKSVGDQNFQADVRHLKRQRHQARFTASPRRLKGAWRLVFGGTTATV